MSIRGSHSEKNRGEQNTLGIDSNLRNCVVRRNFVCVYPYCKIMETGVDEHGERVKFEAMQNMLGDMLQDPNVRCRTFDEFRFV